MASRREKGLCYNCDEIFTPQHKCKGCFFLLITEDPPDSTPDLLNDPHTAESYDNSTIENTFGNEAQLSLHALSGYSAASTIRLHGRVSNKPLTVLIDGGSTHNFVQEHIAKFLELPSVPTTTLTVMVGNGATLDCKCFCADVPLFLQSEQFFVDLYVLPLCGVDIVLGTPWLQAIGHVLMDYTTLSLSFTHQNKNITLTAEKQAQITPASAQQVKQLMQTHSTAELFQL